MIIEDKVKQQLADHIGINTKPEFKSLRHRSDFVIFMEGKHDGFLDALHVIGGPELIKEIHDLARKKYKLYV